MHSVGIDLHRKRSHVAVVGDGGGQLLSRRILNDPETFLALLGGIEGECRVALEATYGWEWLADVLQDAGYELHLAHPMRTKAIASARVKTDAVDARTLAQLLRADLLPEAYIAPRELRDLCDLLRHRVALTRMRSSLKNRVAAILAKHGIQRPYSDLFGPAGSQFLATLELRDGPRRRLDSTLALIADFTREIDVTSREIDAPGQRGSLRAGAVSDPRRRALHRHARDRRGRRHQPLPDGPPVVLLGGTDPDGPQLRRQGPARAHLQPGLTRAALGARRGRPARRHRRRPPARRLRTDRQAPRQADRQGRDRPPHPHPLLLRPARRRNPLPGTPGHDARGQTAGGHGMTRRADHAPPTRDAATARASSAVVNGLRSPQPVKRRPPT
jgi:hypothetical protein